MGLSSVIVQWLVDAEAENDGVDIDGRSALHHAVLAGNDELMHILLDAKVDINIKDNLGLTAMDIAMQRKNVTAIVYILDWMYTLDKNGSSSLHLASDPFNSWEKIEEFQRSNIKLPVNGLNRKGESAIHIATEKRLLPNVWLLLAYGVDGCMQNSKTGDTPLHHAVVGHWKEGIELLLEKGANVNIKNSNTRDTPLHYAAAGHWKEGIELLLAKGADRKIANAQGLLPRDIAVCSGKRISQLEPNAVSRISQKIRFGFGKDTNTGESGQPDRTDKVKSNSKMEMQDDEAD